MGLFDRPKINNRPSFVDVLGSSFMQELLYPSDEMKLLTMIRSGKYDSIEINFKEKKMKTVYLSKTQDASKKLNELLSQGDFQDITLKTHKGKVTSIKNTIKINFD